METTTSYITTLQIPTSVLIAIVVIAELGICIFIEFSICFQWEFLAFKCFYLPEYVFYGFLNLLHHFCEVNVNLKCLTYIYHFYRKQGTTICELNSTSKERIDIVYFHLNDIFLNNSKRLRKHPKELILIYNCNSYYWKSTSI